MIHAPANAFSQSAHFDRRSTVNVRPPITSLNTANCNSWSLIETLRYSLPFPSAVPLANIAIALTAVTSSLFTSEPTLSELNQYAKKLLNIIAYIIHLIPISLAVLSSTYIFPNDILACRTDTRWRELFMAKDGDTIRSIQSRLQCCGFNSMRDRAWPFPSALHGIDAGTCERTSGFSDHCATRWQGQLVLAAGLCVIASSLEQILLVRVFFVTSWKLLTG